MVDVATIPEKKVKNSCISQWDEGGIYFFYNHYYSWSYCIKPLINRLFRMVTILIK